MVVHFDSTGRGKAFCRSVAPEHWQSSANYGQVTCRNCKVKLKWSTSANTRQAREIVKQQGYDPDRIGEPGEEAGR